jgi:hypothetical protein
LTHQQQRHASGNAARAEAASAAGGGVGLLDIMSYRPVRFALTQEVCFVFVCLMLCAVCMCGGRRALSLFVCKAGSLQKGVCSNKPCCVYRASCFNNSTAQPEQCAGLIPGAALTLENVWMQQLVCVLGACHVHVQHACLTAPPLAFCLHSRSHSSMLPPPKTHITQV